MLLKTKSQETFTGLAAAARQRFHLCFPGWRKTLVVVAVLVWGSGHACMLLKRSGDRRATAFPSFFPQLMKKRGTRDSVSIFLSPVDETTVVVVVELAWGLSRRTIAISLFRVWSDLVSVLRRQTVTFADKTSGSQNHRPLETPSPHRLLHTDRVESSLGSTLVSISP